MTKHSKESRRQKNRESALRSRLKRENLLSQLETCASVYLSRICQVRGENKSIIMNAFSGETEFYSANGANFEGAEGNYSDEKSFLKPTAFLLHT